jgi:hypothetical protein
MNFKEVLAILLQRFSDSGVAVALSGGLALSTMGLFRFTRDIDFLLPVDNAEVVDRIMVDLGYEKQDFSTSEIVSYRSPLKVLGQVDFLLAKRAYTKAMLQRAKVMPVLDGALTVRTLLPEDVIGLKVQAIANDPANRYAIDAPDIQRLLRIHRAGLDMNLVREYFRVFDKEELLNGWLDQIEC